MSSPAAAATTTTSVRLAKRALRTEVRAILSAVPRSSVQSQSARVCAHVERLECWRKAKAVSLYLAMDDTGEAQTDELVQDAFANGASPFLLLLSRGQRSGTHAPPSKGTHTLRLAQAKQSTFPTATSQVHEQQQAQGRR